MIPAGIASFVTTTTGKLVVGTTLAVASIGGAHAADVVQVPLLPESEAAAVAEVEHSTESTVPADDVDVKAGDLDPDDEAEDEESNHGEAVSAFAQSTELEGCEKGQAISELASSKADDRRNNPDRDHDPCDKNDDADEAEEDETDASDDDSYDHDSDDDDSDDDEKAEGSPNGKRGNSGRNNGRGQGR